MGLIGDGGTWGDMGGYGDMGDIQSNVYIRHPVSLEQVGDVGGDMGLIGGGGTWGDMGTWGDIQSNVYMGWRCGLWGDAVSYGVVLVMGCCCGLWAVAVG